MKHKEKLRKKETKGIAFFIISGFIFSFFIGFLAFYAINYYVGGNTEYNIVNEIITEGNITYNYTLESYYDVEYKNKGNGLELKINNPCIKIITSRGMSMKPYFDNNTLIIIDTCYPPKNLKIGDIIVYEGEWDSTVNPHHRIIDIDYEKGWVRTQGDNPITNSRPDDFVGFDRIMGKNIGVLNVLEDKKISKKEVLNESEFLKVNMTYMEIKITNTTMEVN